MIVLGVILLVAALLIPHLVILLYIGIALIVIGLILLLLGSIGHAVGGRRWYF